MSTLCLPTNGAAYKIGKRALDLLISIAVLPVVLVLIAVVSVLVKATSPGPIFYRHTRVGLNGKPFGLWKFRTMFHKSDHIFWNHLAESVEAQQEWIRYQKLRRDPRITKIGTFLRRTNLDELPQLFNVLLGEMSLVGPRPVVKDELKRYGAGGTLYAAVLPGITGLWQVSGRGSLPYERRVALDVEYVSTWSLAGDLVVLTKTLNAVWTCRGAY
ncbi:MAG TPA: sugar transferase [Silvibacterium sp.]|jgi:lipopolysaccharide/colanic/teichoic acid biosynthesis glycosyltransferase|nr:sugar transferase [Silvibacterium sp.]